MDKVIWILLFSSLMGGILYLLYHFGCLTLNAKRAAMYIGSVDGKKASFRSCSGYTKRVIRFRETGRYRFAFTADLGSGEVTVEILNWDNEQILSLRSPQQQTAVQIEKGKKYVLIFHFHGASGSCSMNWEPAR